MASLGMETRVWSAVDLAILWGLWAIWLGLDGAETQADRGPLGCVLRDRAIRATGRDPETETWWVLLMRSARWVDASERP
uniref:Uncharacterized protein n=1 Tax=Peronospora matthiolae TaxID=2874970 RepID=A0AAV1TPK7_9STRA